MDNLTHTLTGLALARAGLGRSTRGATLALVVASNLPDVDLVTALGSTARYLEHHRGISHSLLGAPVLALALALAIRARWRDSRLLPLFACALAGVSGHVFMDLWTSYGTRVLSPFDRAWLTWDLVFIVDPWVLAALALAAFWGPRSSAGPRLAAAGLAALLAYVGARALLHERALERALQALPPGEAVTRAAALPSPVDPFAWRVIADTGADYWTGDLDLLRAGPVAVVRRAKAPEDAAVKAARARSEVAAVFLAFSTFPWLEVEHAGDATVVVWRDLRYERPGREAFVTRVVVGPDGSIRSQEFRF